MLAMVCREQAASVSFHIQRTPAALFSERERGPLDIEAAAGIPLHGSPPTRNFFTEIPLFPPILS